MTEYGPEIVVNGVRPEWLREGDEWKAIQINGRVLKGRGTNYIWCCINTIRLLADHPHYHRCNGLPEVPADATMPFETGAESMLDIATIDMSKKTVVDGVIVDDWAIEVAKKDVDCDWTVEQIKNAQHSSNNIAKAVLALARMIQKHEPEREPDVAAVCAIVSEWGKLAHVDTEDPCFQAALAAYKKHKGN